MNKPVKTRSIIIVSVIVLLLLGVGVRDYIAGQNAESAREAVLAWGRLAPFPESARNIVIQPEGGTFSRAFRASFSAPATDIASWVQASPGLAEARPEQVGSVRKFLISPGEGAARAEAEIDDLNNVVRIYVVWS
jgi:hypothetical protein